MELYENLSIESLPNEEWRDVVGYEGLYQVSNLGRILCCEKVTTTNILLRSKIKKCAIRKNGYLGTTLYDASTNRRKQVSIHRLVAEAFIPNPDNKPCVDHIDTNRTNNTKENLRWCTYKENSNNKNTLKNQSIAQKKVSERDGRRKKKISQYALDGEFIKTYSSFHEIERMLGYSMSNIHSCCNGKKKRVYGYIWRYEEDKDTSYIIGSASKAVLQYDLDGNFIRGYRSAMNAEKETGTLRSCISACCRGKFKTSNGFIWRYKDE